MSLLDKFAVVEIKVDARISEQDKQFCERQQAAYTAALHGFQELTFFWEDMLSAQKTLLGEPDSPPRAYNQYLIPKAFTIIFLATIIIWFLAAMMGRKLPFSGSGCR